MRRASEIVSEYEDKTYYDENMLLCDYIKDWIEHDKPFISITTYDHYKAQNQKHIYPYFKEKHMRLKNVRPRDIETYMQVKMSEGLSANTVIKHCAVIQAALQDAVHNGYITTNPAKIARKPHREKPKHTFYNADELRNVWEAVQGTDLELPVFFAIFYGMRRSEVVGLKWSDIDFNEQNMYLRHTAVLSYDGKNTKIVIQDRMKTERSIDVYPLSNTVVAYLLKKQQEQHPKRDVEDFVCISSKGELINPDYLTKAFPKLMKKSGLPHVNFHGLRHSCLSLLVKNNVQMKAVQDYARHANFSVTADIYTHLGCDSKVDSLTIIENNMLLEKYV